jgi:repressor LexA
MLTKKQKEVLDFVRGYITKHEFAPSLEEIRKHFKLASISTAHYYLTKLQKDGFLEREANQSRSIAIMPFDFVGMSLSGNISGFEYISVPLVGAANCGPAELLAEQNVEGYLSVPKSLVAKKSGIIALRAVGKSLNRANIRGKNIEEGDMVLVDIEDRSIRSGDYVLSLIDGAANLKKYKVEKGQIMLVSESTEDFKPIFIMPGDDWVVNGKIIGVMKHG